MKIKKVRVIFILIIICLLVSACVAKRDSLANGDATTKVTIVEEDFNKNGSGSLKCVTEAVASEEIDVDLNYNIDYKHGNILKLQSTSKITSLDSDVLDGYYQAYQGISQNYEDLKHYDTSLIRDSNSVTYVAVIDYDKIDTDKLLAIEGEEDNVIVNGKAKLSLWLELAEKFGTTCEEV